MAASRFGVDYKDDTVFELARTIDAINSRYLVFVMTNTVHTLCNPSMLYKGFQYSEWDMIPHAETAIIEFIMWNREWSILGLPDTHKGYKLYYSHGHHPETAPFGHVFNLDNMLGKSYDLHIGEYQILIDTVPVPVAEAASEAASAADAVFPTTAPLSATTAPLTFFSAPLTSTHPGEKDLVPEGDAEPTFFSPLLYDF